MLEGQTMRTLHRLRPGICKQASAVHMASLNSRSGTRAAQSLGIHRPKFDQVAPARVECPQIWPRPGRHRSKSVEVWATLGQPWGNLGATPGSNSAEFGPESTNIGVERNLAEVGQRWTEFRLTATKFGATRGGGATCVLRTLVEQASADDRQRKNPGE